MVRKWDETSYLRNIILVHDGTPLNTFINLGTTGKCYLQIKTNVTETGCEGMDSIYMARKAGHWRALVIVNIKFRVPERYGSSSRGK
jgi:hypothetical protein